MSIRLMIFCVTSVSPTMVCLKSLPNLTNLAYCHFAYDNLPTIANLA